MREREVLRPSLPQINPPPLTTTSPAHEGSIGSRDTHRGKTDDDGELLSYATQAFDLFFGGADRQVSLKKSLFDAIFQSIFRRRPYT